MLLRNRGDWNQGIEPETAVDVPLPGSFVPIDADGNRLEPTETVSVRAGTGAILFVAGSGSVPEDESSPPAPKPHGRRCGLVGMEILLLLAAAEIMRRIGPVQTERG